MLVTALFAKALNFVVYIFAAVLLRYEYIRYVSEVWYAHKLFIWSTMFLNLLHLAMFFSVYLIVHKVLQFVRLAVLILILIA